jgi:hypothetical protein
MKDWKDAKRKYKMQERPKNGESLSPPVEHEQGDNGKYEKSMDEMRCILYSHGGASPASLSEERLLK